MKLSIKRQNFLNIASWGIFSGETFLAYSMTRLGAERAKNELQASITIQNKRMTQADIDTRPTNQAPQGIMRRLVWSAVHSVR